MKKFCQSVSIEVEVDAIATQLLSHMRDSAQSEIIVEAIIGRALSADQQALGFIHSALLGYERDLSHLIGKNVELIDYTVWGYWTPESIEKNDTVRGNVTQALVVSVDEYSTSPILIEYNVPQIDGSLKNERRCVSISTIGNIIDAYENH